MRVELFKSVSVIAASFFLLAATCSLSCLAAPVEISGAAQQPAGHKGCSDSPVAPEEPSNHGCSHHEGRNLALKSNATVLPADLAPALITTAIVAPALPSITERGADAELDAPLVSPLKLKLPLRI